MNSAFLVVENRSVAKKIIFTLVSSDMIIEDLIGFNAYHDQKFSIQSLLPQDNWEYFYLGSLKLL